MKKRIIFLAIILSCYVTDAAAQSSYQEGYYYNQQGGSDISCGYCYSVLVGYDGWGRPIYQWYQNCRKRVWHSWYGGRYGYYWVCNNGNCYWDYRYETRTWWYFTWNDFTKAC